MKKTLGCAKKHYVEKKKLCILFMYSPIPSVHVIPKEMTTILYLLIMVHTTRLIFSEEVYIIDPP